MAELGARLKAARKAAGMTQHEVTASLGLGAGVLTAYENGKSGVSDERLVQLATLYGVEPVDLSPAFVPVTRPDAYYDGILHALAAFNQASGKLLEEVREWRARSGGEPFTYAIGRDDALRIRKVAEDAEARGAAETDEARRPKKPA